MSTPIQRCSKRQRKADCEQVQKPRANPQYRQLTAAHLVQSVEHPKLHFWLTPRQPQALRMPDTVGMQRKSAETLDFSPRIPI